MASLTLEIGTRVGGYRLEGQIGRGGMGLVYLAEHERLGRKAALKLLIPDLARDETFRERFVRESQLIAAIEHPNIIPIYDAGEVDGLLYVAMRYVEGQDLKTLIEREGRLSTDRALEIVGSAGAALDAAHARELVHRDVKPANILLDAPSGRTFLTDFGIAKLAKSSSTQTGMFIGTVGYTPPEQIQGQTVGPATDVYALGCV
ncbi:MAG: serine/threonine protein kinase, partial [Actinobacteria bacterium]